MRGFLRLSGRLSTGLIALFVLASATSAQVVVESLSPGSALARAGVETGVILDAWTWPGEGIDPMPLATPLAFEELRIEQAPRGALVLHGKLGREVVSFVVEPGDWQARVRPTMTSAERRAWVEVRQAVDDGRFAEALASVRTQNALRRSGDWELECWWWLHTGDLLVDARAFDAARNAYRQAAQAAKRGHGRGARAMVEYATGRLGEAENDLEGAERAYRAILALYGEDASASLMAVRGHTRLGKIAWARGEIGEMGEHYRKALIIARALAPRSSAAGTCLNDVGYLAYLEGRYETARTLLEEARVLLEEIAPRSNEFGTTLHYLGLLERGRSRLTEAERYFRKAMEIAEALAPARPDRVVAYRYRAMGELERMRGDLATAEEYLRRALSIEEVEIPGSWRLALTLTSLADILDDGGRDASAERFYRRALRILEGFGNDFVSAHVLGNLATVLAERGQLEEARSQFQRTLEIYRERTPRNPSIAWALQQLGLVAVEQGELAPAESYFHEAREFLEREAPRHIFLAICWIHLGDLARRRDRLAAAEQLYRRALDIYGEAGAAFLEEKVRHGLGLTLGERGQTDLAIAELRRAVDVLEDQLRRLGGSRHTQGRFRARNREIYDDALAAELTAGRPEEAFHLLERSRARSLLEMLTERDLGFALDLPEELAAARRRLERRYREAMDKAMTSGGRAAPGESLADLARLREEQENLEARLRQVSPRFAALRYPDPQRISQVRASLDPETVLLAYNVAAKRTDLFVITSEDGLIEVITLEIGSRDLRQQVESYLGLVQQRRDPDSPFFRSLMAAGRELYELLIAPAARTVQDGARLLIVPDGVLHQLPFAALVRPTNEYLVAWRPVHTVLSATLYARLRGEPPEEDRRGPPVKLAAFGDPLYPSGIGKEPGELGAPRASSTVRGGLFSWDALPHTRREVEGIGELFAPEEVLLYLGAEATEDAVRSLAPGAEVVHFAVHGHLDDRFPLDSALALTVPEKLDGARHNGLLQAWEIFDGVRLETRLVVLSACSTALGQERGGEGLVGLAHAFHYAGARSILASLWNVNDRMTAELMIRFHRYLRDGLAKDEALRAAQLEILEGSIEIADGKGGRALVNARAPYYWAAFQILGDR